jgi:hypothetical protein
VIKTWTAIAFISRFILIRASAERQGCHQNSTFMGDSHAGGHGISEGDRPKRVKTVLNDSARLLLLWTGGGHDRKKRLD